MEAKALATPMTTVNSIHYQYYLPRLTTSEANQLFRKGVLKITETVTMQNKWRYIFLVKTNILGQR